jgi:hypothetical protein
VCKTGFEPIDGTNALDDGYSDCERIVYDPCVDGQVRDSNAQCREVEDCKLECDGGDGEIQLNFGTCQCEAIVKVD